MCDSTLLLPNYNNERVLPLAFAALRRGLDCSRLHLVAVDDGSEDGGLAELKRQAMASGFARVEIIARPHEGIVPALNAGLEAVKTTYVFRIDGDATVETPGWADRLKGLLRHPGIGLVGGHTLFDTGLVHGFGRSVMTEAGLHDIGTRPLEPTGRRTLDSNVWRPWRGFPGGCPEEVDTVLATCVGFRTEDARAIGGFDMRFNPVWIEDDDFGLSLRRIGKKVAVDPEVRITHHVSARGSRLPSDPEEGGNEPDLRGRAGWWTRMAHVVRPLPVDFSEVKGKAFMGAPPWRREILCSHYARWREKWGFDPINPDMPSVLERYFETELCWRHNPALLLAGRRLLARLAAG